MDMTNEQFKSFLTDLLADYEDLKELLDEQDLDKVRKKLEKLIAKTTRKLEY